MHVLYVTTTYPPDNGWGGIGTYVYHMARGMTALGHRVSVLCGMGERGEYEATEGNLTVIRRIATGGSRRDDVREQIARLVHDIARKGDVDTVEFGEYGAEGLAFQRQYPSVRTVVRLHCSSYLAVLGDDPWWKRLLRCVIRRSVLMEGDRDERESVSRATLLTACSQWVLNTNRRLGWSFPAETRVIPNPISDDAEPAACSRDYAAPLILFLGRLCRLKGADVVPEVVRRVLSAVPEARFEIVGQDGRKSGRTTWKQWILRRLNAEGRKRVCFAGGIPHPQIAEVLGRHSLAFFASVHEAFPYSHLECMQAGLACVVGSGGGAGELGEHGISLVRTGRDAAEIAAWLVRLLKDADERRRLGTEARDHAHRAFGAESIARRMEGAYLRTLEITRVAQ